MLVRLVVGERVGWGLEDRRKLREETDEEGRKEPEEEKGVAARWCWVKKLC